MSERSAVGRVRSEGVVETESDGLGGDTSAEAAGAKKKELADGGFFRFWGVEILEALSDRLDEALLALALEGIAGEAKAGSKSGGRPGA